ncbi:MAG: hypothetical protein ABIQ44_15160 [Chloroflexia bacterium]
MITDVQKDKSNIRVGIDTDVSIEGGHAEDEGRSHHYRFTAMI